MAIALVVRENVRESGENLIEIRLKSIMLILTRIIQTNVNKQTPTGELVI
jgi:hypothetical protein